MLLSCYQGELLEDILNQCGCDNTAAGDPALGCHVVNVIENFPKELHFTGKQKYMEDEGSEF